VSIKAPWTPEQVAALNAYQALGYVHEFTCPGHDGDGSRVLVATGAGWICPSCDYTQDWAHDAMADRARHPQHPMKRLSQ
jgi:hypothetical protein